MAWYLIKSIQLLAHADYINIFSRTKRDVTAAIEHESASMGLAVNEGTTKVETCNVSDSILWPTTLQSIDVVNEFVYLSSIVTSKNNVSLKIKQKIAQVLLWFLLATKLLMYKSVRFPIHGIEARTLLRWDAVALEVFCVKTSVQCVLILISVFEPINGCTISSA